MYNLNKKKINKQISIKQFYNSYENHQRKQTTTCSIALCSVFSKEFEEYLQLNFTEYKQKQQNAIIEANNRAARPLDKWQQTDLGILLS